MEQNQLRKNLWNGAAKAGLVLGGVSSVYLFASQFITAAGMSGFLSGLFSLLLWAAKFGGCIWLMKFFMKKFASENGNVQNSTTFRFGMLSAFLSALVYAAVSFANVAFISADMFTEQMNALMQQMAPMMDSNTMSQMDKTMQNLPQLTFFSNLIYCGIYGTLLSAILSRNIPDRNPFVDYKTE
jgi:hypothetical protein